MNRHGGKEVKVHEFFKCINWKRLEANLEEPPFVPDVSRDWKKKIIYCRKICPKIL